jgi:peptidoglycan DL-endopeptidase CwlO
MLLLEGAYMSQNKKNPLEGKLKKASLWLVIGAVLFSFKTPALADQYDEKIAALNAGIASQQAEAAALKNQANTLSNRVALINAQMAQNQTALQLAQIKHQKVGLELEAASTKLIQQKELLGENLRVIYLRGKLSTLEMLVSSQSLSEFLDQQQYLSELKQKIHTTVESVGRLKAQLEKQRQEQADLIAVQHGLINTLGQQRGEVSGLLTATRGEEARYQAKIAADKQEITRLQAAQAAEIAARSRRVSTGGSGGYPAVWANAPKDAYVDDWGFYTRECTSFAAWWRDAHGYRQPGWGFMGYADAKTWPNWARSSGFRVDGTPEYGAIAVYQGGTYGHVGIVIAVMGNQIKMANYNADFTGRYSEDIWPTSSLVFIH